LGETMALMVRLNVETTYEYVHAKVSVKGDCGIARWLDATGHDGCPSRSCGTAVLY
jgi:hypothetical protein